MDTPEPVNLAKSVCLCNIFSFLFAASKACLFPFLTVYFKMLGLSATETGFIMGGKTIIAFFFAPLWARCATKCGKRRLVLMTSIFMMAATYLSLTAVPGLDKDAFASQCAVEATSPAIPLPPESGQGEHLSGNGENNGSSASHSKINGMQNGVISTSMPSVLNNSISSGNESKGTAKITTAAPVQTTVKKSKQSPLPSKGPSKSYPSHLVTKVRNFIESLGIPKEKLEQINDNAAMEYLEDLVTKNMIPQDRLDELLQLIAEETHNPTRQLVISEEGNNPVRRKKRFSFSWDSLKVSIQDKLWEMKQEIRQTEYRMFVVILVVLMVGETFCSPVEKVADDSWYEFLESIDDLEKYGFQRIWSSLAYVMIPFIITLTIDNTDCLFGLTIHPFMLHFYLFGGFLGLTFLMAFFYPIRQLEKYKYSSKITKGIRVICCNGRGFIFSLTLLVMGMIYASYNNFLFWLLLDLHSKEATLGMCITIAALAELPMLLFSDKLVKKIGNGGVVSIALLFLSARCLYYSFLWTPWAVLPAELTHAFTHTAMWYGILSTESFNTAPAVSRSIRSILSSIYFGIGFSIGSMVGGVVYDTFGASVLFQAGSVMAIACFPVFLLCMKCCPQSTKSEVKYTRLLANDDSEESTTMEDDWLEQALKDR